MKNLFLTGALFFSLVPSKCFSKAYCDSIADSKLFKADTLRIGGYIADCGEFGGHTETILIFRNGAHLEGKLIREKPCEHIPEKINFYKFHTELSNSDVQKIKEYIISFDSIGKDCKGESNAPTQFTIRDVGLKWKEDKCGRWNGFVNLRDALFKK